MKKILSVICFCFMALMAFAKPKINLVSFTDEVPNFVNSYVKSHPDFPYEINITIVPEQNNEYQPYLDRELLSGGKGSTDIFVVASSFVYKYSKGEMEKYSMSYKDLGIDVDRALKEAEIAQYTIDLGTNNKGELKALTYQATPACFVYRRSVAKKVFGTDDPNRIQKIIGGGTGKWDDFLDAAEKCKSENIAILSGIEELWRAIQNTSEKGWIVDGKLYIDPSREAFFEMAKQYIQNDYTNHSISWQDSWFADMQGCGPRPVLGYFGPVWFVNYSLGLNCGGYTFGEGTYGDWAVCLPPVSFHWGGSFIFVNKNISKQKIPAVRELVNWMVLDTSNYGLMNQLANGILNGPAGIDGASPAMLGVKDSVPSNTVMKKSNGVMDIIGGQDMYPYYEKANNMPTGKNNTYYDEDINYLWMNQVYQYCNNNKSLKQAIADFKMAIADNLGISEY